MAATWERLGFSPMTSGVLGFAISYDAGPRADDAEDESQMRQLRGGRHGQNPRSIEKKKLRLGGNGATSMFRTIAWLPKLLTSGSRPAVRVKRSRLRPVSESRAVRTLRPKRPETDPLGQIVREIQFPQLDVRAALHVRLGEPLPERD